MADARRIVLKVPFLWRLYGGASLQGWIGCRREYSVQVVISRIRRNLSRMRSNKSRSRGSGLPGAAGLDLRWRPSIPSRKSGALVPRWGFETVRTPKAAGRRSSRALRTSKLRWTRPAKYREACECLRAASSCLLPCPGPVLKPITVSKSLDSKASQAAFPVRRAGKFPWTADAEEMR